MKNNRICNFCGTEYYYCPTCNDRKNPLIYTRFHDEKCKKAFDILISESSKRITTSEAKKQLELLGFNKDTVVKENEKNHFGRVMNYEEEIIIDTYQEESKEETETTPAKVQYYSKKKNRYKKNSEVIN